MISIAIDGPAGAGKSTISKKVAAELGFVYVDTGALYRTVGYSLISNNVSIKDVEAVQRHLAEIKVDMQNSNGVQKVILNGADVSDCIRTPEVSMAASDCSALACVRSFLLDIQRQIAATHNVVMDGRDIGTVVLPNADIKIFLTADPEERAKRRYEELILKDPDIKYEDVLSDLLRRDHNDSHREIAPLKPADDSITVDTTGNELEESVAVMLKTIRDRL
ncbi:MAG: (d)CMP kinase [bacterium]|nr:(d)CMP kinase [bacterium]